jgi:ABC-type glycerol-3-phosphate transport system substrate-binding protein
MRSAVLAIALGALLVACGGGDKSTGPSDTVSGTFTLRTVNGSNLPFTVFAFPDYKIEITASVLTMSANKTYTEATTWRETDGGTVREETEPTSGTYTRNGDRITFRDTEGETLTGTISGNTITIIIDNALSAVYRQ